MARSRTQCAGPPIRLARRRGLTPYLLTRYFGLRSFSTLYGFTWTAYAIAGAIGPLLMGMAFDVTGSYTLLLVVLAGGTFVSALLYLCLPRYPAFFDRPT